jgi:hypothetical protein
MNSVTVVRNDVTRLKVRDDFMAPIGIGII